METTMALYKSSKRRLATIALISMVFIGIIAIILDRHEVEKLIGATNWKMVPWALLFTAVSYFCISFGFASVVQLFGSKIKLHVIAGIGFVTTVLNHLLSAGGAAGLSVRFLLLRDKTTMINTILAASLFHSYFTSLGMLALLPIGLIYIIVNHSLSIGITSSIIAAVILLIGIFLLATGIVFIAKLRNRLLHFVSRLVKVVFHRDIEEKLAEFSTTIATGVKNARSHKGKFILILALICTDWAASIVALWFCFVAFGNPLSAGVLISGFVIGITAGVLSMVPGGIGVQEGSMSGIYALLGVPLSQAVLAAILFRLVYYLVPFLVSIAFYWLDLRRLQSKANEERS